MNSNAFRGGGVVAVVCAGLAFGEVPLPAFSSSSTHKPSYGADLAFDGRNGTRWASLGAGTEWVAVDSASGRLSSG